MAGLAAASIALALIAVSAAAADPASEARPEPTPSVVDRGHALAEQRLLEFIDGIDRYFGDENFEGTTNESFIRLAPGLRIREGPHFAFKPRLRGNLQLPNTQSRLGLIFSGRDEDGAPLDAADGADNGISAGLRAAVLDTPRTKLRLSLGSRFEPEPDPFVRLHLQHVRPHDRFALRPSVMAFWELDDGIGERTRLDIDYRIGPRSILRLRGDATYGESTQGVEFRAGLTHFLTLRERSAWQIALRVDSRTQPRSQVVNYRGFVRYRWSMMRRWLFFEVEPGIRFEREDDFHAAPELIVRVEIVLGSLERLGLFGAAGRSDRREPASRNLR